MSPAPVIGFAQAYRWLNLDGQSALGVTSRNLREQMNAALQVRNFRRVWELIERLEKLTSRSTSDLEVAEIYLECGRALYFCERFEAACERLREAAVRYRSHPHNRAVALWLLGHAYWHLPPRHDESLAAWQKSREEFQKIVYTFRPQSPPAYWYARQIQEMDSTIDQAINFDVLDQRPVLNFWITVDNIPAGPAPAAGLPPASGHVQVDRFLLEGMPYRVMPLDPAAPPTFGPGQIVLKVNDDVMDQTNIFEGDYVLVNQARPAQNNDIVAAIINGEDVNARLKRLLIAGSSYTLAPESDNPAHQSRNFTGMSGFQIVGVVEAIFKPI